MQQAHGAEQLADLVGAHVFGEGGLQRGRAHAADGRDGARRDEQVAAAGERVAEEAEGVEEDGGAHDGEVERIGGAGLGPRLRLRLRLRLGLVGLRFGAEEAGKQREDDEQAEDARGVDDADEDALGVRVPGEHVVAVEDDDAEGAHRDAEDDRVDGAEQQQVPAEGGAGARAGRVEHPERREQVEVAQLVDPVGGRAELVRVAAVLLARGVLARLGERLRDEQGEEEQEEDVAGEGDVEGGQQRAGPAGDDAGDERADGDAREEAAVEVAEDDVALLRRGAVGRVRVRERHAGDEGAAQPVEDVAQQDPVDRERIGEVAREDGDDLA